MHKLFSKCLDIIEGFVRSGSLLKIFVVVFITLTIAIGGSVAIGILFASILSFFADLIGGFGIIAFMVVVFSAIVTIGIWYEQRGKR